jgi:diguanylate cyclase (GGDEF)-like protein/PAS domain S-box-containing protein
MANDTRDGPVNAQAQSWRTFALPLSIFLSGVVLSVALGTLDSREESQAARAQVISTLANIRAHLESEVRSTFDVTEGIGQLLRVDGEISAAHFDGMAQQAIASQPHIRHIALAPDDVVRNIFPMEGNQGVLGLDYRKIPEQYRAIERSRELKEALLAGPVHLIQGGLGFIHRRPVFITHSAGEETYWGNASVVADVLQLLTAGGIVDNKDLQLALRGEDGSGASGAMIYGDAKIFQDDAVTTVVDVPGGGWELAALPLHGWPAGSLFNSPLFLVALTCTGLFTYFAAQLSKSHLLVRQRHADLAHEIQERQTQKALLLDIVDNAPSLIYVYDTEGKLRLCNRMFEQVAGHTFEEMEGKTREYHLPPAEARTLLDNDRNVILNGGSLRFEDQVKKQGMTRTYLTTKCILKGANGQASGVLGISTDNTEIKQRTEQLRLAGIVLDNTADGVIITNARGHILSVNAAFVKISGFSAEESIGLKPNTLITDKQDNAFYRHILKSLKSTGLWRGELWNRRKNGEIYPQSLTINAVYNEGGNVINYVAVFSDISAINQSQSDLERMSHYDPLTALPNRALFNERLQHSLDLSLSYNQFLAVVVLDLDGFKTVNDSLGHSLGDLLLQQASSRFLACVRCEDTLSRLGGDEFALILNNLSHPTDAIIVAKKLLVSLQVPFDLKGASTLLTASIGISVAPHDSETPEQLLRQADTAMSGAKKGGRNDYRFYQPEMTLRAQERLNAERCLRRAVLNHEFEMWYQPKINLLDNTVAGAEALIRWRDPDQGLISPGEFIPLAENTGLIIQIGEQVIDMVCRDIRRWADLQIVHGVIAINVAPLQIDRSDFVETLRSTLQEYDLPAHVLEVEVTEGLMMASPDHSREVLSTLQNLGVTTSIDDFGTGYSSLAYLKLLPIDHLKIDRSFISDLPNDSRDVAITKTIVELGHALGFKIIAEGVETAEQSSFLKEIGCDQAQGYLYGRPMPAADYEAWLNGRQQSVLTTSTTLLS